MRRLTRIPPGRTGRLWLRRRLATAEAGQDQLERKLRVLVPELERRRLRLRDREEEWTDLLAQAQTWLLRVGILGGQDAVEHARAAQPVRVEVPWATTVGVRYPDEPQVLPPDDAVPPGTVRPAVGNSATDQARAAFRAALLAGVRTAAAAEAVRLLEAESAATRRRLRALDKRWVPMLRQALAEVEIALEQSEQEDTIRLRRALGGTEHVGKVS